jgi:uncharacterized integral membrane protein (TIGR00697 family)
MKYKYFHIVSGIFVATLLISNTIAVKIISVGSFAVPAGILCFPLSYIFGDILTEVYGYERSRSVIWTGFFSLGLMSLFYLLAEFLRPAPFWNNQNAFELILGQAPRIAIASLIGYWVGEFTNSYVLSRMKIWTNGKFLWTRTVGSTVAGQAVDTIMFNIVAFVGLFSTSNLIDIIITGYILKVLYEVIATPLTYKIVGFLKRVENEDKFDYDVKYNPFIVKSN